ncbi:MAG: hydrogenase expression/formation protein HypE [Cyanobacteriota bacterium]
MRSPEIQPLIRLGHGGGGTLMRELIDAEFRRLYADPARVLHDASVLADCRGALAFTVDSTVVQPLEFPGGDIGSLAVIGTANDLAMAGARARYLSLAVILEEGLPLVLLRRIIASIVRASRLCGVTIETGDTKVVERGKGDGLFLSTSGIGVIESPEAIDPSRIQAGDRILVSGDLGRHGLAILACRHGLDLVPPVGSDCAPLWPQVEALLKRRIPLHCLRDLTRGGLAMVLQELADVGGWCFRIEEEDLPIAEAVICGCQILGLDPLHLACEGRFVAFVPASALSAALAVLRPAGGRVIGTVVNSSGTGLGEVILHTALQTQRRQQPPSGELLPRIC